jgi:hypothetical protein
VKKCHLHKLMLVLCSTLRSAVHYYTCFLRERHQYPYKIHVHAHTHTYPHARVCVCACAKLKLVMEATHSLLYTHITCTCNEALHYYMDTFCIIHTQWTGTSNLSLSLLCTGSLLYTNITETSNLNLAWTPYRKHKYNI